MRLNAIAALRAPTMAITIQNSFGASGQPPAARMALSRANGRANTVCSNLIISRVILRRLKKGIVFSRSSTSGSAGVPPAILAAGHWSGFQPLSGAGGMPALPGWLRHSKK